MSDAMPCTDCQTEARCDAAGLCQEYRAKIVETPKTCAPGRFCARYAMGLGGCVAGFCNLPKNADGVAIPEGGKHG